MDKTVRIHGAQLQLASLPVFYLPFIYFPFQAKRHTGLLSPSLNFSQKSGWVVEQNFFWAISRSQDMTFGLKQYELRGLKGLLEYRYVLSQTNHGQGNFAFLQDRVFNKEYERSFSATKRGLDGLLIILTTIRGKERMSIAFKDI